LQRLVTSGLHNSEMTTDRRKFTTKITLYGILVSISAVGINSKLFPGVYTLYKKPPEIFCDARWQHGR